MSLCRASILVLSPIIATHHRGVGGGKGDSVGAACINMRFEEGISLLSRAFYSELFPASATKLGLGHKSSQEH